MSLPQHPLQCVGSRCDLGGGREALGFMRGTVKMELQLPVDLSSYNLAPVGFY